ncbi:MAG TPA: cytochrome c [Chromatiaceae bacterium]|nr:cytochrome c [Chromatiaceae bacterium]HIB84818.1 cytochrome c [Chromatiaceae bacterium]HIN81446.1 cytochrome c [Chromatiales bacterium]HIO14469.1 cytochrome c [Chromatiales bacterium]
MPSKKLTGYFTLMTALLFSVTATAGGGDEQFSRGKALLEEHCITCHGSEMYTRPNRRVTSTEALGAQVRRCDANLGLKLFDEDADDIAHYLNKAYYKF